MNHVLSALLVPLFAFGASALQVGEQTNLMPEDTLARDLVMLSFDTSHTTKIYDWALKEMGWTRMRQVDVFDKPYQLHSSGFGTRDNARLYTKHCDGRKNPYVQEEDPSFLPADAVIPPPPDQIRKERDIATAGDEPILEDGPAPNNNTTAEVREVVNDQNLVKNDIGENFMGIKAGGIGKHGRCEYCVVAFAPTDDKVDIANEIQRQTGSFCGIDGVHEGYAKEAHGFALHPKWHAITRKLTDDNCKRVIFTGASIGGAVASLMAFCAAKKWRPPEYWQMGTRIKDVFLVTFGAPPPTLRPLYRGQKGLPFHGMRFALGDENHKPIDHLFASSALAMMANVFKTNHMQHYGGLMRKKAKLDSLHAREKDVAWSKTMFELSGHIVPIWNLFFKEVDLASDDLKEAIDLFIESWKDELVFDYDPMPGLQIYSKYVHPLLTYQSTKHPFYPDGEGLRTDVVFKTEMVPRPLDPILRTAWGMIAFLRKGGKGVPNHRPCCYAMSFVPGQHNCRYMYTNRGVAACTKPWL